MLFVSATCQNYLSVLFIRTLRLFVDINGIF